jgi:hypothetical protein
VIHQRSRVHDDIPQFETGTSPCTRVTRPTTLQPVAGTRQGIIVVGRFSPERKYANE